MPIQRNSVGRRDTSGNRACHLPEAAGVAVQPTAAGEPRSRGERWGALLVRCARGDVAALGALYDDTVGWSYPLVHQAATDVTTAESLAKDFYLQIWQDSALFRPGTDSAVAWILQRLGRHLRSDSKASR